VSAAMPSAPPRVPRSRLAGIGDEAALDLTGQIEVHEELMWTRLELRTVDGVALADLPEHDLAQIADRLSEADLTVPCLDSRIGGWARPISCPFERDMAELKKLAWFAKLCGARFIRIMSYPNDGLDEEVWRDEVIFRIGELAEWAAGHDVVLLHENCSGWAGRSAERALTLMEQVGGQALRLLFDIGNPVAHGYAGLDYLREILPWVRHVHVKDARRVADGDDGVSFVLAGKGSADVAECIATLLRSGYQGVLSIEPHTGVRPHLGHRASPSVIREKYVEYARDIEALLTGLENTAPGTGGGGQAFPEGI
jgi:L-ribulose-5-phosphate 3-epimerase